MKEETLEDAAEKYRDYWLETRGLTLTDTFIAGAQWQQEQDKNKYSEEEVRNLFSKYQYDYAQWVLRMEDDINGQPMPTEWFEQHKNKL